MAPDSPEPLPRRTPETAAPCGDLSAAGMLCHLAALLDALHCGAFLVDRSGRIVHANRRVRSMMQYADEPRPRLTIFDIYPTDPARTLIQDALDCFDQPTEREFYLPRRDGTRLPVIFSGRRLDGEPPLSDHRIVTVIDISPQKRAEQEREERYREVANLSDTVLEQALELKRYAQRLEERVHERTLELNRANTAAVYMLAVASEAKDTDTGAHVRRIEHYTRLLAREVGLAAKEADRIAFSSILHDVGKIHVPDAILRKPGALSEEEWVLMRQHTTAGERILSREPFFDVARSIARSHHENWDGSGYLDGLRGAKIPLAARLVRVADVYDALTSVRPYKQAWSPADAAAQIEREQEKAFDPDVVRAFLALLHSGRLTAPHVGDQPPTS